MKYIYPKTIILITLLILIFNLIKAQAPYNIVNLVTQIQGTTQIIKINNIELKLNCDSTFLKQYFKYRTNNNNQKAFILIDSSGCPPYNSDLFIHQSKDYSDYLIIWRIDFEHYTEIHFYYMLNDKISKIETIIITPIFEKTEAENYSIDYLKIIGNKDNTIDVLLLEPFNYIIDFQNFKTYKPEQAYFKIDKKDMTLKLINK